MDNQIVAAWIGTAIFANLAMSWKILLFIIEKVNEYNNLKTSVQKLHEINDKMARDLDAAHRMIRDLKP